MPTPAKAEKKEPPVEIVTEEKQPQPAAEVEIDVSTGKPVESAKPAEPTVSAEEFRKLAARFEYRERQAEKTQRELMERINQLGKVPQPASPAEKPVSETDVYGFNKEELNQLGQTDWTKPVKLMAEKIADKRFDERIKSYEEQQKKLQQEQFKQQTNTAILEREKARILAKNPSLNDESSEEFRGFYATYNRMIQEDPTLVQNPYAPRLVYNEWKDASNSETTEVKKPDPETERLKRVAGGVSPQGRSSSTPKTIRLTQAEVDMCKEKGISPAVFASMKEANFKEGVTA